ncbi:hypothetical protein TV39_07085 [Arthrobacter sp. SPG23]|nr:hypothetical protein TV39_07085 [Arthrobacter sp. SPG23]
MLWLPILRFAVVGNPLSGNPVSGNPVSRDFLSGGAVVRSGRLLARGFICRERRLFRDSRLRGRVRREGRRLLPPAPFARARFGRLVRFLRIAQDQAFPAAGLATA